MFSKTFQGGEIIANPYPVEKVEIIQAPLPDKVVLPMQQRVGIQANPCVKVGDTVLTGQVVGNTEDIFCVPIHASISGTVIAIDEQVIPHRSGLKSKCITIQSDGKDTQVAQTSCDFLQCEPSVLITLIQNSGIVGLGGAGFPIHTKLSAVKDCHTLIINGTECEPGIMCDDALMQHYPHEIIRGVEILLHICGASRAIIAIENDKQEAFNALFECEYSHKISLVKVPTKYTSGAEKLLIKSLLDITVPFGEYAIDIGVICQNVATVKAVFDCVTYGKPLVSRVVTVTGSGVESPNNYEVRLGAPFAHIIALSKPNKNAHNIRMGGMMMGVDVANADMPICKITNCIFVNNPVKQIPQQECIRCGACNLACPVNLLPQQLYWHAKNENIEKTTDYNLQACIECRCCDYVCPSHIPLAQYFIFAKTVQRQQILEKTQAGIARERFEYRQYRLERNQQERAKMMADKREELKKKMADDQSQKAKITAAMERVKKTKQ